jgi:uncharacterized Fe-S cluster-containing radical SAM superfamily protein
MLDLPFNPLKRTREVEGLVMEDLARKYYRFRPSRYYGGIATADIIGCPFLCAYCWNYGRNLDPEMGREKYYSPGEVGNRLLHIAKRGGFNKIGLSGAEPILGEQSFEHLYQVLQDISNADPGLDFILATNGLLLGYEPGFVQRLSQSPILTQAFSQDLYLKSSCESV